MGKIEKIQSHVRLASVIKQKSNDREGYEKLGEIRRSVSEKREYKPKKMNAPKSNGNPNPCSHEQSNSRFHVC